MLAIVIGILRAANGHYALTQYSAGILIQAGLDESFAAYATILIALGSAVFSVLVVYLVEKAGRRPLILYPLALGIVSWSLVAIFDMIITDWSVYVMLAALLSFLIVVPFSSTVGFFLGAELVPQVSNITFSYTISFSTDTLYITFYKFNSFST